jgi:hypothetical protein
MTTNFLYGGANGDSDSDEESYMSGEYGDDDPSFSSGSSSSGSSYDPDEPPFSEVGEPRDLSYGGKNVIESLNSCIISMNRALIFFNRNIRNKINLLDRLSVQNLNGVLGELHTAFNTINLNYFSEGIGEGRALRKTMLNLVLLFEKLDNSVDNAVKSYAEPRRTGAGRKSSSMSGGILILNSIPDSQRRCPTKYLL